MKYMLCSLVVETETMLLVGLIQNVALTVPAA